MSLLHRTSQGLLRETPARPPEAWGRGGGPVGKHLHTPLPSPAWPAIPAITEQETFNKRSSAQTTTRLLWGPSKCQSGCSVGPGRHGGTDGGGTEQEDRCTGTVSRSGCRKPGDRPPVSQDTWSLHGGEGETWKLGKHKIVPSFTQYVLRAGTFKQLCLAWPVWFSG